MGYGYGQYRPAYHYGSISSKVPRYSEMDWNMFEL
jgi:hypothetical protein